MTRLRGTLTALALVATLSSALPGGAQDAPVRPGPRRLLVSFAAGADRAAAHRAAGGAPVRTLDVPGGWDLVAVPASAGLDAVLRAYRRLPGVRAAEPDAVARAAAGHDDPCVWTPCGGVSQWNLSMIEAPLAWEPFPALSANERQSADPVLVAVLDSRIDATHPDFRNAGGAGSDATFGGQIDWSGQRSWVDPSKRAGSLAWHGTFVAGILAAAAGNGTDIAGVAYPALVLPYEVLDGNGRATASGLAEAITAAHRAGARVINLSLGLDEPSQAVRDALIAATSGPAPALVVAAAGNHTRDIPFYPASYPEAMSVSGVDASGVPASCSNYNDNVSVAAPARNVLSLAPMPGRLRTIDCGTSAAAPHVSGVAALLLAQDRSRTPAQVRAIIESSAIDDTQRPGWDRYLGHGIVNADRALRASAPTTVDDVRASVPARGATTTTITALAHSPRGVTAAEVYLGGPGHPSGRYVLRPADGQWGGATETLTGELPVTPESPAVQALFVRAFDGDWGRMGYGRLLIDRAPPAITGVRADTVIRVQGGNPAIIFTLGDDTAQRFTSTVTVMGPDGVTIVWESGPRLSGPGPRAVYWDPPVFPGGVPGPHRVEIWVWDEAGNPASALTTASVI